MEAAAKTVGHSLPTATTFRKAMEVRNKRLPDPLWEAVSHTLCHSSGTAETYYRAPATRDTVQTYKRIGAIVEGKLGGSPDKTPPPPTLDQDTSSQVPTAKRGGHKGKGRARSQHSPSPRSLRRLSSSPSPTPEVPSKRGGKGPSKGHAHVASPCKGHAQVATGHASPSPQKRKRSPSLTSEEPPPKRPGPLDHERTRGLMIRRAWSISLHINRNIIKCMFLRPRPTAFPVSLHRNSCTLSSSPVQVVPDGAPVGGSDSQGHSQKHNEMHVSQAASYSVSGLPTHKQKQTTLVQYTSHKTVEHNLKPILP